MESLESQFRKIRRNIYSAAYRGSYKSLEAQARRMCERITELADKYKIPGMTGNTRAGVAVGLYQNGKLQGYATTAETDNGRPIYHALMKGEEWKAGRGRYDRSTQNKDFSSPDPAKSEYRADERAIAFLRRARPLNNKGWSYVIASGAHYAAYTGFVEVLKSFSAELSQLGAKVRFGNVRNR